MPRRADPFADRPAGLRTRARADGTVRVWWEPNAHARRHGFDAVELDENRPTWSKRQAERMNADVAARAAGRAPLRGERSLEALSERYQRSSDFTFLAAATQRSYRTNIRRLLKDAAPKPVATFDKPYVKARYEEWLAAHGVRQAKALVRMLSILMAYAEGIGWRAENTNPCLRMKLREGAPGKRIVSWAEFDALLAAADAVGLAPIALAAALSRLNGQRETDVLAAAPAQFPEMPVLGRDEAGRPTERRQLVWLLTRSKRATAGAMPVHPDAEPRLRAALEAHRLAERGEADPVVVDPRTSEPYKIGLFNDRWAEVRALAAKDVPSVADVQFRDLRRTFSAMLRSGGADRSDIAAVLGNTSDRNFQLAQIYMPADYEAAARAVGAVKRSR